LKRLNISPYLDQQVAVVELPVEQQHKSNSTMLVRLVLMLVLYIIAQHKDYRLVVMLVVVETFQ